MTTTPRTQGRSRRTALRARPALEPVVDDAGAGPPASHGTGGSDGPLDADALAALAATFPALDRAHLGDLRTRRLAAGQVLCEEGDTAEGAWLLVRGRLRALRTRPDGGTTTLGEVGPGELLGESGLLEGGTRRATLVARRDAVLVPLDRAWFASATAATPTVLTTLVGSLTSTRDGVGDERAVVALVPAPGTENEVAAVVGAVRGLPGVAVLGPDGADALPASLERADRGEVQLLLVGDATPTAWNERLADVGDQVVVFVDAEDARAPVPVERALDRAAAVAGRTLVLVHPSRTAVPTGTAALLAPRPGVRHLHLRRQDPAHRARVGRLLLGRGLTLVLGGGGGRALAQVGVHEELRRLGLPVDAVAGTSAGAVVAAAIAQEERPGRVRDLVRDGFTRVRDHTLPVVGLLRGRRVWRSLTEAFGTRDVEDLWLPFGCVATDLTALGPVVLTTGPLREALRATVAVPGVFPPFERDGHLLVDGGLVDNLPVGLGRKLGGPGPLVAVDVAAPNGPRAEAPLPHHVSGLRVLVDRVRGRGRADQPSLATTVTQAMLLPAARARLDAAAGADLVLDAALDDVRLLDFSHLDRTADLGAHRAGPRLTAWLREEDPRLMTILDHDPTTTPAAPGRPLEVSTGRALVGALWLAVADLRHRLRRFVVAMVAAAVTLTLLLLMTGVVNQFDREPSATTGTLGGSHWVLRAGIENPFTSNATFPVEAAAGVLAPGVATGQVLLARLPVTVGEEVVDAILVGHPATGPGAPVPDDGTLAVDGTGVAVSTALEGASVGDPVLLGDQPVTVVGEVADATLFAGMPLVFAPVDVVRARLAGGAAVASALLLDAEPLLVPAGFHVRTAGEVAEAAKGPVERPILTLHVVRVLLGLVAAMIIGAVVYLASIERTRDVAVLRAVGVERSMLAAGVAAQALVVALTAAAAAVVLEGVLAPLFPLAVHLTGADLLVLPLLATLIAVLASYAAVRRTLRVDPSAAFAGAGG